MSKIATATPTTAELRALRDLMRSAGESQALTMLGLHREPVARMLAGLGVRAGTVYQLRARLSEIPSDINVGQR